MNPDPKTLSYQAVYDRWAADVAAAGVDPENPTPDAETLLDMRLLLAFGPQVAFGADMGKRLVEMSDEEMVALFSGQDLPDAG